MFVKIRVFAIAKEMDVDSKVLIGICHRAGIKVQNSALASLSEAEYQQLQEFLAEHPDCIHDGVVAEHPLPGLPVEMLAPAPVYDHDDDAPEPIDLEFVQALLERLQFAGDQVRESDLGFHREIYVMTVFHSLGGLMNHLAETLGMEMDSESRPLTDAWTMREIIETYADRTSLEAHHVHDFPVEKVFTTRKKRNELSHLRSLSDFDLYEDQFRAAEKIDGWLKGLIEAIIDDQQEKDAANELDEQLPPLPIPKNEATFRSFGELKRAFDHALD